MQFSSFLARVAACVFGGFRHVAVGLYPLFDLAVEFGWRGAVDGKRRADVDVYGAGLHEAAPWPALAGVVGNGGDGQVEVFWQGVSRRV